MIRFLANLFNFFRKIHVGSRRRRASSLVYTLKLIVEIKSRVYLKLTLLSLIRVHNERFHHLVFQIFLFEVNAGNFFSRTITNGITEFFFIVNI